MIRGDVVVFNEGANPLGLVSTRVPNGSIGVVISDSFRGLQDVYHGLIIVIVRMLEDDSNFYDESELTVIDHDLELAESLS